MIKGLIQPIGNNDWTDFRIYEDDMTILYKYHHAKDMEMIDNILWFFAQQCVYAVYLILVHAVLLQQRVAHCHVHSTRIIIHFSSSKKLFTYMYSVDVYIVPTFNHREMTVYVLRRTISFPYITGAHPHRTVWNFSCLSIMTPRLSDVHIIMPLLCTYLIYNPIYLSYRPIRIPYAYVLCLQNGLLWCTKILLPTISKLLVLYRYNIYIYIIYVLNILTCTNNGNSRFVDAHFFSRWNYIKNNFLFENSYK